MSALVSRKVGLGALVLAALFLTVGCGARDGLTSVTGQVTFDGKPVEEGRILFRKKGEPGRAFSGPITNGSYSLRCDPGEMLVEITASRPIPGKFDTSNGTPEPVGEMYIPARYNSATTLTADVSSSKRTFPFELKSK